MKRFLCAFLVPAFTGICTALMAQNYTVTLEEHATDIIPGQTTYRLYVDMVNEDDFLTSVYGGDTDPLSITTSTGSLYNDQFGSSKADGINPAFFAFFPTLVGDSWITIGIESQNVGDEVAIGVVEDPNQPFVDCFASGSAIDGGDVLIDSPTGGAWYVLNGTPNGLPDENMRVLVMQMTTDGEICGTMNFQIFENGDGQEGDMRFTYTFCGVGTYSPSTESGGCTDATACNFDAEATEDDGSCTYAEEFYDCDGNCVSDTDGDGICDELEVAGCTDAFACNYDMDATDDNGTCDYLACVGCTDAEACNYNPDAIYEDGSCEYTSCATVGCTNSNACNYNPEATVEDGSCDYTSCVGCTDEAACNFDPIFTVDNGSCDYSCQGCTDENACNYSPAATEDDGSCTYAEDYYNCSGECLMDMDGDGVCDELEVEGCTDPAACNYDMDATNNNGSCEFAVSGYDCAGNCLNDSDGDGVCDEFEVAGCTNAAACNYNMDATDDDGSCTYAEAGYDCAGNCLNDADGDGVCDEFEVAGCTDATACNYNMDATDDDGSCEFAVEFYDCEGNCLNDADGDGVCDELEVAGCTDAEACNYNMDATDDDGSCEYAAEFYDCEGNCLNDADGDGVCDELEIAGCTDPEAENFNADATDDDGSCYYCDVAIASDSTNETEGDASGTINVDVTGGTAPYEFAWSGPDAFASADEDLTNLSEGTYTLTVTDANGCTATIEVTIDNVTNIAEINALTFQVYPNPTYGNFWIQGEALNGVAVVDVLDGAGRLVESTQVNFNGQPVAMDLQGVETGFYQVVIRNSERIGTTRLLVH